MNGPKGGKKQGGKEKREEDPRNLVFSEQARRAMGRCPPKSNKGDRNPREEGA